MSSVWSRSRQTRHVGEPGTMKVWTARGRLIADEEAGSADAMRRPLQRGERMEFTPRHGGAPVVRTRE